MIKTPNRKPHVETARAVPLMWRARAGAMSRRHGGAPRADIVPPHFDGATRAPTFTAFVRQAGLAAP
jgi:hypothetical protein